MSEILETYSDVRKKKTELHRIAEIRAARIAHKYIEMMISDGMSELDFTFGGPVIDRRMIARRHGDVIGFSLWVSFSDGPHGSFTFDLNTTLWAVDENLSDALNVLEEWEKVETVAKEEQEVAPSPIPTAAPALIDRRGNRSSRRGPDRS